MKYIIKLSFVAGLFALFMACSNDIPAADWETYEVKSLIADIGDTEITLQWEIVEGSNPAGFYVSWVPDSSLGESGETELEAGIFSVVIGELKNGESYTFSIQPVYDNSRRGGKVSLRTTPVSDRLSPTGLLAAAGNEMVRLKWTRPGGEGFTGYFLTITPGNREIEIDKERENYDVYDLIDNTEYTFSLAAIYPKGLSDILRVKATPGDVLPILVQHSELVLNEICTFEYNEMYFTSGEIQSVVWDFGDGATSTQTSPQHSFSIAGDYTVKITVNYGDRTYEEGSLVITVKGYAWSKTALQSGAFSGYVKVSNPVFSPDGRTIYIPTSTPNGHLFAVDMVSGQVKWVAQISTITYGGGAAVGPDGTIYQCGTDRKVYAVNPSDGSFKWSCDVDAVIGAFPALSSGILYCVTNGGTLYAVDAVSGVIRWNKSVSGTGSALAADNSGNVYVGTGSAIFKFDVSGEKIWESAALNVTERGAFAISGTTLYAALKGDGGVVAINMASGTINWTYPNSGGDAYFPVVGPDGTVYFNEKGSSTTKKVFAVNPNGSLKWEKDLGVAATYCGLVLGDNGVIYCGTQGKTGNYYKIYGIDTASGDIEFTFDSEEQIMACASIGPDKRLYIGTIGSNNVGSLLAIPVNAGLASSWSVRGGNLYGTNNQ